MYRVSPALNRFAAALLAGAALATLWVNLAPLSYYDFAEWRIFSLRLPDWLFPANLRLTPVSLIGEGAMALFIALIAKELWEALVMERGPLAGAQITGPLVLMTGAILGAVSVWLILVLAFGLQEDLEPGLGWTAPIGSDVVLCYAFGRLIFGAAHPALKLLLLISIAETLFGLLLSGLFAPGTPLRPLWLLLPLIAAGIVWSRYGHRPAPNDSLQTRQRAAVIWPYVIAGLLSWIGVFAAGLPGALGLLPILPAIAHADRSFGLFAEAEGLLHDPLNRLAQLLLWPVTAAIFAFGLTFGAVDLSGFGLVTLAMLAALWLGKPLGLWLAAWLLFRYAGKCPLIAVTRRDLILLAPLFAIAFTAPALGLGWSLPQGAATEAARLGLALSLLAGPAALLLARRLP
ncbi:MAG: Na+/H+ antiporter NhaA [Paracoccaceae bacterium]